MSELGKRLSVAGIGIPGVLGLAFFGGWFLALPLAGFAGWAAHECYRFAVCNEIEPLDVVGVPTAAALVLLAAWRPSFTAFAPLALGTIGVSTLVALLLAMAVRGVEGKPLAAVSVTVFGALYCGFPLAFMSFLHELPNVRGWAGPSPHPAVGLLLVALPLAATWIGDAAAYFAGTAWGRKKLAPSISPNKSWVGFWADLIGGAIAAVLWSLIALPFLPGLDVGLVAMAIAGALMGTAAVMGDLVESLFKREAGVKDSGTCFPGHGGVLDRIDSLIFTVPTAYCMLLLFGGGL